VKEQQLLIFGVKQSHSFVQNTKQRKWSTFAQSRYFFATKTIAIKKQCSIFQVKKSHYFVWSIKLEGWLTHFAQPVDVSFLTAQKLADIIMKDWSNHGSALTTNQKEWCWWYRTLSVNMKIAKQYHHLISGARKNFVFAQSIRSKE